MSGYIKLCGFTRLDDALFAAELGVDAVGLNFWPGTPRCVSAAVAKAIVDGLARSPTKVVGVFVDAPKEELLAAQRHYRLDLLQLHGNETPELCEEVGGMKALGVRERDDLQRASDYPGRLLLDAKVEGAMPGGTGRLANWELIAELSASREVLLAGGLTERNVAEAIQRVLPFGVDTASGIEECPGVKSRERMEAFVREAREAFRARQR